MGLHSPGEGSEFWTGELSSKLCLIRLISLLSGYRDMLTSGGCRIPRHANSVVLGAVLHTDMLVFQVLYQAVCVRRASRHSCPPCC